MVKIVIVRNLMNENLDYCVCKVERGLESERLPTKNDHRHISLKVPNVEFDLDVRFLTYVF